MVSSTFAEAIHQYVGIDISKQWLDVWLRPQGRHLRCGNDPAGFDRLDRWLTGQGCRPETTVLCLEHTGIYGKRLLMDLTGRGWKCAVEKTTVTDKVGPEHHRKDDAFDAALLAEYADRFTDQLHLYQPPEKALQRMRQLYSERRRLVRQRTATRTKRGEAAHQPVRCEVLEQGWREQLELLDQQIEALENEIQSIVATHQGLDSYYQLLVGIPGIGRLTAWLWLITFYGQTTLNPKKIASRFGFAPHSRRSGSSVHRKTRSSGHGLAEMRATMTLAVRSASTHSTKFKAYKQRKLSEGKPWPVVRNNLINKLITITCAIWNSGQPYDPDHQSRFDRQKQAA